MNARRIVLVAALALIAPTVSAQNQIFMKVDAIVGEAVEPFHVNWIELSEFTLSAGALDPTTQVFNFRFSFPLDRSFVPLLEAQQAQQVFNKMDVHTVEPNGGSGFLVNTLTLRNLQLGPMTLSSDETGVIASGSVIGLDRLELQYRFPDPNTLPGVGVQATFIDYTNGTSSTALVSALEGDYNVDGRVAEDDYTAWAGLYGSNNLVADGNRDGTVDAADYTVWRDQLPTDTPAVLTVPEPTATMLLLAAAGVAACGRSRRVA